VPKRKSQASFTQRILNLIAEPEFIQFENILGEPNFFKIVGRAHYERWHSAFFGWLLDASGSHLLGDYVLRRFLLLLLDELCLKARDHSEDFLFNILPLVEFSDIQVTPSEYLPTERSVSGLGRFDIFLIAHYIDENQNSKTLNIIFELKIDSRPDSNQSSKYADWLFQNHTNDVNFLIYLTPKLKENSKVTVGDERWYCIDYQLLSDKLFNSLLDHPKLNEKVKPFIIQYIKNLKTRHRGTKMAITNEEKRLAVALYEKYNDVFDSIYDALVSVGAIDFSTSSIAEAKGRASGRMAVKIDNKVFARDTVRQLFEDVLKYIVDEDYILKLPLPWGIGKNRYIITNENPPVHPNGRAFFYPVAFESYTIESHYSRERAIKVLSDISETLGLEFEEVET
jgi:PD-(D/E)XK nuclease superfamily